MISAVMKPYFSEELCNTVVPVLIVGDKSL